ncbi:MULTISPECIES: GNAT family N-acetyltransferase [unclassified Rothia (in: high G+C Gram-positive bacteria)]|uniref:GNAT family N-acetyltransferase n=1 Tax=unclassified Rothia (in: high G+C Gram-positive bacteria) TaxID=2689056 RepID=UPI001956B4E8|nr:MULTISPECIES: GNAT family N-acetyltransferase [unclassified Rothia (in: high G+C Gram-positive bacteria)]MBM7050642.1 GNAT family N-acetyltransferase [Rothia sp. ZJ1223]QRZ60833.1 GNAT family N-acetyltransferase [Rothia sp. ZJ932]
MADKTQIETRAQDVTITYLQMLQAPADKGEAVLPENARLERVEHPTPELARWLYSAVGGPWRWYERLTWSFQQWADELAEAGAEIWLLTVNGTPSGYCQLAAHVETSNRQAHTETEILYFGLLENTHGQGLGRALLTAMVNRAWDLHTRHPLPPVKRVWVHTCTLDGAHALANYQRRGFEIYGSHTEEEIIPKEPLTGWQSMFITPADLS